MAAGDVVRLVALTGLFVLLGHHLFLNSKQSKKDGNEQNESRDGDRVPASSSVHSVIIYYATRTKTSEKLAKSLLNTLESCFRNSLSVSLVDLATLTDPDDVLASPAHTVVLFILPTYPETESPCVDFLKFLDDARFDFRVARWHQRGFSVFGIGDTAYGSEFAKTARNVDSWMQTLQAKRVYPLGTGDVADTSFEGDFHHWITGIVRTLSDSDLDLSPITIHSLEDTEENQDQEETEALVDVEDMGVAANAILQAKDTRQGGIQGNKVNKVPPKDMVTPQLRQSLTKQGYKIVGTHSGVKLCRWTKAALRGRGFCYKHAFYGIESHRCMETTPSLACANKCVFCWRHHTNPVGTEWKWTMDEPEVIFQGALENHRKMVKEMRGVPGVRSDRFEEAWNVRHCALSLVGEPIMVIFYYRRANHISSILRLTNSWECYMTTTYHHF